MKWCSLSLSTHTAVDLVFLPSHICMKPDLFAGLGCSCWWVMYGKQTSWMRCLEFLELSLLNITCFNILMFDVVTFRNLKCCFSVQVLFRQRFIFSSNVIWFTSSFSIQRFVTSSTWISLTAIIWPKRWPSWRDQTPSTSPITTSSLLKKWLR